MSKVEEVIKDLTDKRNNIHSTNFKIHYRRGYFDALDLAIKRIKEVRTEQEELQKKADAYDEITNATADRDNLEEKIILRLKEFLEDEYDCHGAEDFEPVIKHYAGTLIAIFEWHNKQTNMTYTYAKKIIEKETGVTIPHNFAEVWEARGQIAALMNTVSFELDKRNDDRSYEQFIWDSLEKSKPVEVPQFVADEIYLQRHQRGSCRQSDGLLLTNVFSDIYGPGKLYRDDGYFSDTEFFKWIKGSNNVELFVKAVMFGYTVKQEQLYYVFDKLTGFYLVEKLTLAHEPYTTFKWTDDKQAREAYTEEQIRKYMGADYMGFAVKVEEQK